MKIFYKKNMEDLIYVFFGIYVLSLILDCTSIVYANDVYVQILRVIRYICYAAFTAKIIQDWIKGSKITKTIILLLFLSIIIALVAKDKSIFFLLVLAVALRNMDFNKLVKIALMIFLITFFLVIILSLLKIVPDWTFLRKNRIRHSLGFIYATDAIGIYLSIVLMYFYVRKNKSTIYEILALEVFNIVLFYYTDGRTSFILITIILTTLFLSKFDFMKKIFYSKFIQNVLKITCYSLPILLFIVIHAFVVLYGTNNTFSKKVDSLLSGRIRLTYEAYKEHNITLFGQEVEWNGWGGYGYVKLDQMQDYDYNYVDSSYPRILLGDGILFTSVLLFGYTALLVRCYKEKDYWLLFVICFVLIWSFVEQHIISIRKNIFVLAFIPFFELGAIPMLDYKNIKSIIKRKRRNEEINN